MIYDPCGGWGHRLLGTQNTNTKYIYNDKNIETYNNIQNIIQDFNIDNCLVYNNDCSKFIPNDKFDSVFTCPPYYNDEIYEEKFISYDKYLNWWDITVKNCNKAMYFCFIISNKYNDDLLSIMYNNNYELIETVELKKQSSHFKGNSKEIMYILKKANFSNT